MRVNLFDACWLAVLYCVLLAYVTFVLAVVGPMVGRDIHSDTVGEVLSITTLTVFAFGLPFMANHQPSPPLHYPPEQAEATRPERRKGAFAQPMYKTRST